jgi:hypothetical protein
MTKRILGTRIIFGISAAALMIAGAANAEPAASDTGGKSVWKIPQVQGSAPVKEEPKSNEIRSPRAVGQSTKGAVTRE